MAMLTARPTYSAMTPRLKRITPVATMRRIIVEVQPGTCHRPDARPAMSTTATSGASSTAAAPSALTHRRGRVPLESTSRQKCEASRRRSYPDGRSPSARMGMGQVVIRRATHEIATSR